MSMPRVLQGKKGLGVKNNSSNPGETGRIKGYPHYKFFLGRRGTSGEGDDC